MAFTIGKYGVGSLLSLGKLMGTFYLTCLVFILVVLGIIARVHGFSILKFIRYIKEELLIVLGTSSSESVLPRMMAKLVNLGVKKSTVGLVIPTGYSFNLDGTSIYLTLAALFVAQATNTHLTAAQEFQLLVVLMLTSKGAAAVTGGGFITLAATLSSLQCCRRNHAVAGCGPLYVAMRSLTNLAGNAVATVVVAKWVNEFDSSKAGAIQVGGRCTRR
jgi:aerobic C4-dicarboxylate transport protein